MTDSKLEAGKVNLLKDGECYYYGFDPPPPPPLLPNTSSSNIRSFGISFSLKKQSLIQSSQPSQLPSSLFASAETDDLAEENDSQPEFHKKTKKSVDENASAKESKDRQSVVTSSPSDKPYDASPRPKRTDQKERRREKRGGDEDTERRRRNGDRRKTERPREENKRQREGFRGERRPRDDEDNRQRNRRDRDQPPRNNFRNNNGGIVPGNGNDHHPRLERHSRPTSPSPLATHRHFSPNSRPLPYPPRQSDSPYYSRKPIFNPRGLVDVKRGGIIAKVPREVMRGTDSVPSLLVSACRPMEADFLQLWDVGRKSPENILHPADRAVEGDLCGTEDKVINLSDLPLPPVETEEVASENDGRSPSPLSSVGVIVDEATNISESTVAPEQEVVQQVALLDIDHHPKVSFSFSFAAKKPVTNATSLPTQITKVPDNSSTKPEMASKPKSLWNEAEEEPRGRVRGPPGKRQSLSSPHKITSQLPKDTYASFLQDICIPSTDMTVKNEEELERTGNFPAQQAISAMSVEGITPEISLSLDESISDCTSDIVVDQADNINLEMDDAGIACSDTHSVESSLQRHLTGQHLSLVPQSAKPGADARSSSRSEPGRPPLNRPHSRVSSSSKSRVSRSPPHRAVVGRDEGKRHGSSSKNNRHVISSSSRSSSKRDPDRNRDNKRRRSDRRTSPHNEKHHSTDMKPSYNRTHRGPERRTSDRFHRQRRSHSRSRSTHRQQQQTREEEEKAQRDQRNERPISVCKEAHRESHARAIPGAEAELSLPERPIIRLTGPQTPPEGIILLDKLPRQTSRWNERTTTDSIPADEKEETRTVEGVSQVPEEFPGVVDVSQLFAPVSAQVPTTVRSSYNVSDKEAPFPVVSEPVTGVFPVPFSFEGTGPIFCWPYYMPDCSILLVPYLGLQKLHGRIEQMVVLPALVQTDFTSFSCPPDYSLLNLQNVPTYDPTRAVPPPPPSATAPKNQPTKPAVQRLVRQREREKEKERERLRRQRAAKEALAMAGTSTPTGSELSQSQTTASSSRTDTPFAVLGFSLQQLPPQSQDSTIVSSLPTVDLTVIVKEEVEDEECHVESATCSDVQV